MKEEKGQRQKIMINKKTLWQTKSKGDAGSWCCCEGAGCPAEFPTASWELRTGHTPVAGAHLAFMGTRHVVHIHASKILIYMIENEKNIKWHFISIKLLLKCAYACVPKCVCIYVHTCTIHAYAHAMLYGRRSVDNFPTLHSEQKSH